MDYQKRLLKFLKANPKAFTTSDIATIWKRSKEDVGVSVALSVLDGLVKVRKDGVLLLKGGIAYDYA